MKKRLSLILAVVLLVGVALLAALPLFSSRAAVDDAYTMSLLHFDGTDASTTFTDDNGRTWTANGNAQLDTAQKKFGTASGLFDGTGDWIDTPDHADFDVGSGNFTVDMWVKKNGDGAFYYLAGQANSTPAGANESFVIQLRDTNLLKSWICSGGTFYEATSTGTITGTAWHHIAVVRNGNTLTQYIDGVADGTADVTGVTANNATSKMAIGRVGEYASSTFNGWIDEFRFSKGIARWTGNFTPPTENYYPTPTPTKTYTYTHTFTSTHIPFPGDGDDDYVVSMLRMNGVDTSTVFTDERGKTWTVGGTDVTEIDTAQYKFGGASGRFNINSYISSPDSNDWCFGSGDFTIDFWVRFWTLPSSGNLFDIFSQSGSTSNRQLLSLNNYSGYYKLSYIVRSSTILTVSIQSDEVALSTETWYHVALVRHGNDFMFYLNGIGVGGGSDASEVDNFSANAHIGQADAGGYRLDAWLDEFRVSKGIARWLGNFDLPPSEYTTPTPTPTLTPSNTPTPTATFTVTQTYTPSKTPTKTGTQTRTPTRTPTITKTPIPGAYIIWAMSSYSISDAMELAVNATLLSSPPDEGDGNIYGIVNIQQQGSDWILSVANLPDLGPPYETWNIMEDAQWIGSLICSGAEPNWNCPYYLYSPAAAGGGKNDTALIFPWRPGTSSVYGTLGVHSGYSLLGPSSKAVDFVGGDMYGSNGMPAYAYAATTGTITGICRDSNNQAVKLEGPLGSFVYLHLSTGNSFAYGQSFNQGEQIGALVYGPFGQQGDCIPNGSRDCKCGWAQQGSTVYHLHFAFLPAGGYLTIGGCNLNISTQQWICGSNTIGIGGTLQNSGGSNPEPPGPEPVPPSAGGEHIWDGVIYAIYTLVSHAVEGLLPPHDTRITFLLERGLYVLQIAYQLIFMFVFGPNNISTTIMRLVIALVITLEITYWILDIAFTIARNIPVVSKWLEYLGFL